MDNLQKSDSQESTSNSQVAQRQVQPGSKNTKQSQQPTLQAKQRPIQAKQRPIQAKQRPIQAKQQPIQRNTGSNAGSTNGNVNEAQVKANVSALTGTDVTDAKVHYNSNKPAQLQAEATAQGDQVHLASGKERHLGHELTHVAQQKQGRVKPTIQANNGMGINNDPKLEKEADDIGAKAHSNQPIQAKSISSGTNATGSVDQPMQLKFRPGKISGKELVGIHKSNYKDVEEGKGFYFFSKRPTQVTVESGTKVTLKPGQFIMYDPEYKDKTGKFVRVRYRLRNEKKMKYGFVEASHIKKVLTPKEKKAQEKKRKQQQIEQQKLDVQQDHENLITNLRDASNVGVEVEIRNVTLTRGDNKNWDDDGEPVTLTSGGKDGVWVTDQHSANKAIIEWNTDHPKFKDSNFGGNFQEKLDRLNNALTSSSVGTFAELVNLASGIMDVGSVVSKCKDVGYDYNQNYVTQTQVNMEVPLQNIGKIPQKDKDKKHDSAQMFSGAKSRQAKEVFIKSRKYANDLTAEMLAAWNNDNPNQKYKISDMENLISTMTIFMHTAIFNGLGGGKDPQGVLFKTGAGDLVRSALLPQQKKVLWHAFHESSTSHIDSIATKGASIYKQVFKGRGGKGQEIEIHNSIFDEVRAAFIVKDINDIEDDMQNANTQEEYDELELDLITALQQDARWGDELTKGGYGNSIATDMVAVYDNEEYDTTEITGVSTGKDFGITQHSHTGKYHRVRLNYILAEIRRNDNEINKLVKKKGISPKKREELKDLIQNIQTPY